jgi:hypothetical protein
MSQTDFLYAGIASLLNSTENEKEIRLFIAKFKRKYIKEWKLSKIEAENRIRMDLEFLKGKFIKNNFALDKLNYLLNKV